MSCLAGRFLHTETVLIKTSLDCIKTLIAVFINVRVSYDIINKLRTLDLDFLPMKLPI